MILRWTIARVPVHVTSLMRAIYSLRRIAALLLLASLVLLAWWMPRYLPPEPMDIAFGVWPGAETLILARERGLLDDREVRYIEMTWDSASMRALSNGVVQAAVLSMDEVVRLRDSGHDVRVVLIFDQSVSADALAAGVAIPSLADLRGKRVGVDVRASGMVLLAGILDRNAMAETDIQIVPMSPPEMPAALARGAVDACVCPEPWLTVLRQDGARVLAKPDGEPILRVLAVSAPALSQWTKHIQKLVRLHFDLRGQLTQAGEVPGREVLLRRERLDEASFRAALGSVRMLSPQENRAILSGQNEASEMFGRLRKLMLEHRLVRNWPEGNAWLDPQFVSSP